MTRSRNNPAGREGYETRDADAVSVALAGALVLIMTSLAALVAAGLFHYFNPTVLPSAARASTQFPEPRLQVAPEQDLKAMRTRDEAELHSYGWIDRRAGIVRIPIERAMDLLLEKGPPVRGQPGANPPQKTDLELQQERPLQSTP